MRLIKKKDFAAQCGVHPSLLNHKTVNFRLGDAVVGKKIDITHPAAIAYMNEKPLRDERKKKKALRALGGPGIEISSPSEEIRQSQRKLPSDQGPSSELLSPQRQKMLDLGFSSLPSAIESDEISFDFDKIEKMTLAEINERFGGVVEFQHLTTAQTNFTNAQTKHVKLLELRGQLIKRELVDDFVFETLKVHFRRLSREVPLMVFQDIMDVIKKKNSDLEMDIPRIVKSKIVDVLNSCVKSVSRNLDNKKLEELNV